MKDLFVENVTISIENLFIHFRKKKRGFTIFGFKFIICIIFIYFIGPHMMGGHPNGGPSPPIQPGLPPLGGPLGGLEGIMDLQTVGFVF